MIKIFITTFILIGLFTGCSLSKSILDSEYKEVKHYNSQNSKENLDAILIGLSDSLVETAKKKATMKNVMMTSVVNLHDMTHTNDFGRALSESMIHELNKNDFKVIDYRGNDDIAVNNEGQFFLKKEVYDLKLPVDNTYVFVGTYSPFDYDTVVINVRLIDIMSSEVIASAKEIYKYKDCEIFELCVEEEKPKDISKTDIKIIRDDY